MLDLTSVPPLEDEQGIERSTALHLVILHKVYTCSSSHVVQEKQAVGHVTHVHAMHTMSTLPRHQQVSQVIRWY